MVILRTDIERALDEIASQEEGMRFQGLAVVVGKNHWPELIARQRKKDFGLDAYAPASLTPEKIGKGLAASITPTLKKVSHDAETAKENFSDLKELLFVTSAKVGNADRRLWEETILKEHGLELHIIEREEIITLMMMPENSSLRASFLHLHIDAEPEIEELIYKTRRAANAVIRTWASKTGGHSLIELSTVRLEPNGAKSAEVFSLERIDQSLSQSRRIVLEGSAGRGKTTSLIQLAQRARTAGTSFIIALPAWTSSNRGILEYIAGMPAFQTEGLTATDLARVQQTEPFLFLLNGWNEIAESNSDRANEALRELERDFPSAGIIVATRTHHLKPPLPGSMRLRLLPLNHKQRSAYLEARLGAKCAELSTRINADPPLDELTRTPFILSEVASLYEAGAEIPPTKFGVLAQVLNLQENRDEHRNSLQTKPIFGRQEDYLKAFAIEMTRRGTVALPEPDARTICAAVSRELADSGQIEMVGAPAVLATLTAHHVLERVDYPQPVFQFEHQQLQEYLAALDIRAQLLEINDGNIEATDCFTADYVNDTAWAEPLRMIAETFAEMHGNGGVGAGVKLVKMALAVDLVFASELAQFCGTAIWKEVRTVVGERLRTVYAIRDDNYQQYAVAAMLATGADDFCDVLAPILSGQDQQIRLSTYRLWPDIKVSSLGLNWRDKVRGWDEEARVDFVSELLHDRANDDIVQCAAEDSSSAVKEAAASGLIWTGSDDGLIRVLETMDTKSFEDIALKYSDLMPEAFKSGAVDSMRKYIANTTDPMTCLRTALKLIEIGQTGLDEVIKGAMTALLSGDARKLSSYQITPVLEYLRGTAPVWTSEWVATQIAEGNLYGHEYWLPFLTAIPDGFIEKYLKRLETEDFNNKSIEGMIAVVAACADHELAARVFKRLRELQHKIESEPGQRHEFERNVMRQLESIFRRLPGNTAAAGILSSTTSGDPLDIKVATNLLSKVARSDESPLNIADNDLKTRLRSYLKANVELVTRQDDFNGEKKANLASSIAQVGEPDDMSDLVTLISADIERVRRGRAAFAGGDRGALAHGGRMSYATWHLTAVMRLDPAGAVQVLIDLLPEPEYRSFVATEMVRDFLPKSKSPFERAFQYKLIWPAREGRTQQLGDDMHRAQFAAALNAEIKRLREQEQKVEPAAGLKELANALAVIDGHGSAATVIDVITSPGQWDHYTCLEAAKRLLMAGVILPTTNVFALVDSILERMEKWIQDSDRYLLCDSLALCAFTDDPSAGIFKIREGLDKQRLWGHHLGILVTALGESRSDAAIDLLYELASDAQNFEQCNERFINAFSTLDTSRSREILMGFIDPDTCAIEITKRSHHEDVIVARITEMASQRPEIAEQLRALCQRDLPEPNRYILSKIMALLDTPEALVASLNLVDDSKSPPVPQGIWDQIEGTFIERRPDKQISNAFTLHARASNELRVLLYRMAIEDEKRRKSAFMLLGKIEEWRLEYGRPTCEQRHPDLASGQPWPPNGPDFSHPGP